MIAVVSGSGLDLIRLLDHTIEEFSFASRLDLDIDALSGHPRKFVRGTCAGRDVIVQCGRLHFYEGYTFERGTRTVDVLHAAGATQIVFTNVTGGLRPGMKPGCTVAVRTLTTWPYVGWPTRPDRLVTDFVVPGCDHEGVYCWMHGPSYETPAEIRALQAMGGDVVGMSTAPEVARCAQLGLPCGVVSCVTNNCCEPQVLTHEEVVGVAREASARVVEILRAYIVGAR